MYSTALLNGYCNHFQKFVASKIGWSIDWFYENDTISIIKSDSN